MRQPLTREAIARAARQILVSEGLHAVSLRRVASMLGVTAPALYAHVADKRDLLQGIVGQEFDLLIERFRGVEANGPIEQLEAQCRAYVDHALQNEDLFRAMFLFRPELTGEQQGDEPALINRLVDELRTTMQAAQAEHRLDAANLDLAALTLWSAVHGVVITLLAGPPMQIELRAALADSAIGAALTGLRHGAGARAA